MDLRPGDRFDRYVIESPLGHGGMGRVYRAHDARLARAVALKILRLDVMTQDRGSDRFVREARAAAALEHPNIVGIHDVGEVAGTPFIAMELVQGLPLRALVGDDSVPLATRIRAIVEIARALAAAHERGIIHRDVKPENVMVRADGAIKVLDFGIAHSMSAPAASAGEAAEPGELVALAAFESLTRESGLVGTPRYMAPEQLRAEPLDPRTDQFAWGVVAYELLTGASPWAGDGAAVSLTMVQSILRDEPVPDELLDRSCPPEVARVVRRALSKSRDERYASMRDLLSDLEPAAAGRMGEPQVPSRSRWLVIAGVTAALAGATAVASTRVRSGPPSVVVASPPAPAFAIHPSRVRRLTTGYGCDEFPAFTPDGTRLVYSANRAGFDELLVVRTLSTGAEKTITRAPGVDLAPAISPDGRLVAYGHSDDKEVALYVVDIDGASPPRRIASGSVHPGFSPDGTAVWGGDRDHPTRYDLATGSPTRALASPVHVENPMVRELPDGRVLVEYPYLNGANEAGLAILSPAGELAWLAKAKTFEDVTLSPDGRFVLGARQTDANNPEIFAVPLAGGPMIAVPLTDAQVSSGLGFSPDGKMLVWSSCRDRDSVGSFDAKSAFVPLGQPSWQESGVVPIPGTTKLAMISERTAAASLWVVDVADKEPPHMAWAGDDAHVPNDLDVSPDGKLVALEIVGQGLLVVDLPLGSSRVLTTGANDVTPRFGQGGKEVLFGRVSPGAPARVFSVSASGGEPKPLLEPTTTNAAPSAVDRRVAYLERQSVSATVPMLVDLATGERRHLSPKLPPSRYLGVAFSRDGKRVALIGGETRLIEVDAATGSILRDADTGAQITTIHYGDDRVWGVQTAWHGNVWAADLGDGSGSDP